MYKPGYIKKIQVKNFVTYNYVEMYPGPNLNMIIGPNGTGKSTMVAAIILGLGGNPKIVGRGSKMSEYVKHNCEDATINIFLQDDIADKHVKITRQFDIQDKTVWRLNDQKASLAQVDECIRKFNIQVNNLCQFLPQDRVQDFAKLNKQDLLKQTQIALCRLDLIEKQESLITYREKHKELISLMDRHRNNLQETKDANVRLEGRVANFNKKMKYKEKIAHIDRKIAWMGYEDIKEQLTEIKADKTKAQEVLNRYQREAQPMESQIKSLRQKMNEMQNTNSRLMQTIKDTEISLNKHIDNVDDVKSNVQKVEDEVTSKISEIQQKEKEIECSMKKLEEMTKLQQEIVAKCVESDKEKHTVTNEINKFTAHLRTLEDKKYEIEQTLQDSISEVRALENKQRRIENVKQQRLDVLRRLDNDAYEGVLWLRNNKHLFRNVIFEPIMLEINVLDGKKAVYVEKCVPFRDRMAFTCVDKNDANLLIKSLRQEQHLKVSVLHSGNDDRGAKQFLPDVPIEHLRKFGFYTYVNTLFTAPEPIMRYLCKSYHLHNIPVGDESVNDHYENVPQRIRSFFSDKFRFSISYSKYSGERSTRQMEIQSDGGLSLTLDIVELEQLKGRANEIRRKTDSYGSQLEEFTSQIQKINEKITVFRDRLKEIQQTRQHAQAIESRINAAQKNLGEMRKRKANPEQVRREGEEKIVKIVRNLRSVQEKIQKELGKFTELIATSNATSLKVECCRQKMAYLDNQTRDLKQKIREAQEVLTATCETYTSVMHEAKAQLTKAKSLSNGFTPTDDGFEEFRVEYEKLPNDMQKLNSDKENLLSRMVCLNTADDGEMKEYEDRLHQIENLQEIIEKTNTEFNRTESKIERLQEEWLTPLRQLVGDINERFSVAFQRMGCAGEISICTGENDKDFSKYGLSIKVTYRNGEPLQELNSTVQSGGERAVATAAFMLSLQELTPVPFRCVDEINQGMDPNNERRIFEMIVDCTCQPDTSQYFLITPKLVPHLKYSRQMAVHIVHNGPFVAQDRKWGFSKLCNPQGVQIQ